MFNKLLIVVLFIFLILSISDMRNISLYYCVQASNIACIPVDNSMNCVECKTDISTLCSVLSIDNIRISYLNGSIVYEGYSNRLKDYRVVDGVKVNIQMSYFDEKLIVGYPLIYASF